jgi:hypothetical protein
VKQPNENMHQNNAARRLCNVLEKALKEGKDDQAIYEVIGNALGIENPNQNRHELIEFILLLEEVEKTIQQFRKVLDIDRYIPSILEIQSLFISNGFFQNPWLQIRSAIETRNFIIILSACADLIAREQVEVVFTDDDLSDYLQKAEEILKEVIDANLPEDIKTFLVIRLEEICTAIRHYTIGGPDRLRAVVEANIGGMILRSSVLSSQKKEKPLLNKLFTWLINFGAILDFGSNAENYLLPKLLEAAQNFFPPG